MQLCHIAAQQKETSSWSPQADSLSCEQVLQKQTERIRKHFTPVSYQTWKDAVLEFRTSCHSWPILLAQLSTTLKTRGDPREGLTKKKNLLSESVILSCHSTFLLPPQFISHCSREVRRGSTLTSFFKWGKRGPICKNRTVTCLGQFTELFSGGRSGNQGLTSLNDHNQGQTTAFAWTLCGVRVSMHWG